MGLESMTKQYIIKRFFKDETETPYLTAYSRGWSFTNNISESTFYQNPEDAFVQLNKVREEIASEYGTMVVEVEFKETKVMLKVEAIHIGGID